jgi:hypothetical protein
MSLQGIRVKPWHETKKAGVAEHPEAFDHVGLLVNEPTSYAELLFIQSSDTSMLRPEVHNARPRREKN